MFIARVSKGRTVREFLMAVLLAPTLTGFVWFTVFGNTALNLEQSGVGGMAQVVSENMPAAIYVLLEQFPLAGVTGFMCTLCVVLFLSPPQIPLLWSSIPLLRGPRRTASAPTHLLGGV